jgi:hypothetical protein
MQTRRLIDPLAVGCAISSERFSITGIHLENETSYNYSFVLQQGM